MQPLDTSVPLEQIEVPGNVKLWVLRLDLLGFYEGGNKYFKLKYNLEEAGKQGAKTILTFGGAWSNHLAAVAAAVLNSGQETVNSKQPHVIAVVRGEEPEKLSDTLRFCKERGIQLHFVSREEYRRKSDPAYIEELRKKFGDFYLLPEGGSNEMAVKGCREILDLINIDFDFIACPVGSGGTLAGITSGLRLNQKALGFVAIKGGEYMEGVVEKLLPTTLNSETKNFKLIYDYHFGGFAKTTPELLAFKKDFEKKNGFGLDYVYTSKMFYGLFQMINNGYFKEGSAIVAVHTGGLQGNKGVETA
ncbi:MAG: 1-aminocyclopropane-1-carboxylate deaminase/D-cysteine desulfhydrase [Bacteroidia bacterium]